LSFRLSSTRINKGFYPLLRKITINRRAPFTSCAWIIFIAPTEIILFALRYLIQSLRMEYHAETFLMSGLLRLTRCRKKEKSFSVRHLKNPAKSVILVRLHRKRRHTFGCLLVRQFRIRIRRCIEVVVTRTTRNRFVQRWARGFESHHLRHFKRPIFII
jgi:hypothetical protein